VALSGCMSLLEPSGAVEVRTDQSSYTVVRNQYGISLEIPVVVHNQSNRRIYLSPCGMGRPWLSLEKLEQGEWRTAIPTICTTEMAPPIEVQAGASYQYTARFFGSLTSQAAPEFLPGSVPGKYRVALFAFSRWGRENMAPEEALLPAEQRTSNPIQIVE